MADLEQMHRDIGGIDANVKTLLARTEKFDDRLSSVEKKVWWASGFSAMLAFVTMQIFGAR